MVLAAMWQMVGLWQVLVTIGRLQLILQVLCLLGAHSTCWKSTKFVVHTGVGARAWCVAAWLVFVCLCSAHGPAVCTMVNTARPVQVLCRYCCVDEVWCAACHLEVQNAHVVAGLLRVASM